MNNHTLEQRLQNLEDRAAIRQVSDTFSSLADKKDIAGQIQLFTKDAELDVYFGETHYGKMKGREEIGKAFASFSASFETFYHSNGQCLVEVAGERATANHYCQVMFISSADGKKILNSNGVIYRDELVKSHGHWLIAKRTSHFTWSNNAEMAAA